MIRRKRAAISSKKRWVIEKQLLSLQREPTQSMTMKKISRNDIWLLLAQIGVCILVLALPVVAVYWGTHDWQTAWTTFQMVLGIMASPMILYFANFYVLGPFLFFKRRYVLFVLVNLLILFGLNYPLLFVHQYSEETGMDGFNQTAWVGFYAGLFSYFVLNVVLIAVAVGIRQFIKVRRIKQQLKEERAKHTEAELAWLKNQINPHFLFNTLNNISSLTQIDADAAQDAIAQLSDLLRYAMYESDKPLVAIGGEIEFMSNYISLMRLRCNDNTTVKTDFAADNAQTQVAPLLFISLVENAFKHGVSSNRSSHISVSLRQDTGLLVFVCDNTNYPKTDGDRSGSGIGLENTRRRLQLLYPGRYEWEQGLEQGIYHVKITITL